MERSKTKMKNIMKYLFFLSVFFLGYVSVSAQDDLFDLFEEEETTEYTYATFKTTRVVNAHSVENVANGELIFLIQHRFGRLNTGPYELFGLDQSTIRFGFEYGVNDLLNVGIGRSSFNKTFDGYVKFKILRQSTGLKKMPLSLTYLGSVDLYSTKWDELPGTDDRTNYFSSRLTYVNQLLIARKFSKSLSLQLMPTHIHKNLVVYEKDQNDIIALGAGGRFKINNRTSVNAEYFYVLPDQIHSSYTNILSLGIDIETGGHVFQLIFSNGQAMFENGFITQTNGSLLAGDVYFGFNISRVFNIKNSNKEIK